LRFEGAIGGIIIRLNIGIRSRDMAKTVKQGWSRVVSTLRADGHLGADMNMDNGQWGIYG
jgi:hypothetical protein